MLTAPSPRLPRRAAAVLLSLLTTLLLVGPGAGAAHAADGFKYWNYFHVTGGKYVFAQTGPSGYTPKDGSVEAYRYGLSSTAAGLPPRAAATAYSAADLCKGTTAGAGEKSVGVLIDYGTTADAAKGETPAAPRAACAVVPSGANGQQVLDAVADIRLDKQLLCGIDGYPVTTCSVTVKNPPAATKDAAVEFALPAAASPSPTAAAAASSSDSSSSSSASDSDGGGVPWPLVGVLAAVVVIAGGAFALNRRTKSA